MKRKEALAVIGGGTGLMALGLVCYFVTGRGLPAIAAIAVGFILFTKGGLDFLKLLEAQAKQAVEDAGESRAASESEKKREELDAMREAGLIDEQEYRYAVKRTQRHSKTEE